MRLAAAGTRPDAAKRDDASLPGGLNVDQVFAAVAAILDEWELMPFSGPAA